MGREARLAIVGACPRAGSASCPSRSRSRSESPSAAAAVRTTGRAGRSRPRPRCSRSPPTTPARACVSGPTRCGGSRTGRCGSWSRAVGGAAEENYEKARSPTSVPGRSSLASIPVRAYDTHRGQGLPGPARALPDRQLRAGAQGARQPAPGPGALRRPPLGVHGIALLPGPLQHVLSIGSPMLAPTDYRTQPIAIQRSDAAGEHVPGARDDVGRAGARGEISPRVRGIETDLVDLVANRYNEITADETLPSNVSFWPRVTSIVINDKAFAGLTGAQREPWRLPVGQRSARRWHASRATSARRWASCASGADQRGSLALPVGDAVASGRAAHRGGPRVSPARPSPPPRAGSSPRSRR